ETRHRGAEMLELVGLWRAFDTLDDRNRPVVGGEASYGAAKSAPAVERRRRVIDQDAQRTAAHLWQMKAVARRAPGQSRRQRRRAALEIRTRPAHRIGIDHDPGVAERRVLVARRRLD